MQLATPPLPVETARRRARSAKPATVRIQRFWLPATQAQDDRPTWARIQAPRCNPDGHPGTKVARTDQHASPLLPPGTLMVEGYARHAWLGRGLGPGHADCLPLGVIVCLYGLIALVAEARIGRCNTKALVEI